MYHMNNVNIINLIFLLETNVSKDKDINMLETILRVYFYIIKENIK